MTTREELESSYKTARKALKADLDAAIANLEKLQMEAIDDHNQEKADEYNDLLQKANSAKTLLIMTRVYELTQTEEVQQAIEKVEKAGKDLSETLSKEGLSDQNKLENAKKVFEAITDLLNMIKKELDKKKENN